MGHRNLTSGHSVRRTATVVDREGLHARPCTRIARAAQKFKCDATIGYGGATADARSILQLLGLAVPGGATVEIVAVGNDAAACVDAVVRAVNG